MNPNIVTDLPDVYTFVDFASGPTGYIVVDRVVNGPAAYEYMPFRNGHHLKLALAMREHGQAEVSVRLKSGDAAMVVTALSPRSITLAAQAPA